MVNPGRRRTESVRTESVPEIWTRSVVMVEVVGKNEGDRGALRLLKKPGTHCALSILPTAAP